MNEIRYRANSQPSLAVYYCRNCRKEYHLAQMHFDNGLYSESLCSNICKKHLINKFERAKSAGDQIFEFIAKVLKKRVRDFDES